MNIRRTSEGRYFSGFPTMYLKRLFILAEPHVGTVIMGKVTVPVTKCNRLWEESKVPCM